MGEDTREILVFGVLVEMKKRQDLSLPTANVAAVKKNSNGEVSLSDSFSLEPRGSSLAEMLADLGDAFANRVRGLKPDTVVVRRAERPRRASHQEGPKRRLLAEGALVYAAASAGAEVMLLSGRELAQKSGTNKDAMDAAVGSLVPADFTEAVAAAIAVLDW